MSAGAEMVMGNGETRTMSTAPARKTVPRLESLTTLRFFAAAAIVILHTRGLFGVPETLLIPLTLGQAVTFFFILSGFVLAYVYPSLDRHERGRFFVARLARIWPLHVAAFAIFTLIVPLSTPPVPGSATPLVAALNLTLLHAWVPSNRFQFSFNAPSWSISVELFFYACFPLLIANWRRTWPIKIAIALALAAGAVLLANRGLPLFPAGTTATNLVYNYPLARLWEFTLGIGAANVWRYLLPRVTVPRSIATLLELAVLGLAYLVVHQSLAWLITIGKFRVLGQGTILWLIETAFASFPFAALLCVLAFQRGWCSRILSWSPLVLLGEISFGIYLLHVPVMYAILYHPATFAQIPSQFLYPFFWLVLILVSYLSWSILEIPARRAAIGWWDRYVIHADPANRLPPQHPASTQRYAQITRPTWRRSLLTFLVLLCIGVALR